MGHMELVLLTVPGCPNGAIFSERLAVALSDQPGVVVHHRVIGAEPEAAEAGMHGSPTLLVDGIDPFAGPAQAPSVSCRLYRDAAGRLSGAPSVADLQRALTRQREQMGRNRP